MKVEEKYRSSTHYLLSALMPYTEANLKLSFVPKMFFADLARLDRIKEHTLRTAYYRSIKKGLIELDTSSGLPGLPRLTAKGKRKIAPYTSKKLKGAHLMVVFDIAESSRWKRQQLRTTLREFDFHQIQKSVWISSSDCRGYVKAEIKELDLANSVRIYECREL